MLESWCIDKIQKQYAKSAHADTKTKLASGDNLPDALIQRTWTDANLDSFRQLLDLIKSNQISGKNSRKINKFERSHLNILLFLIVLQINYYC